MVGYGGEGGIRTLDTVARIPHFECGAFDHSATSPQTGCALGVVGPGSKRARPLALCSCLAKPFVVRIRGTRQLKTLS